MVFFRGKFRRVESSSESDSEEDVDGNSKRRPPPDLTGDASTEMCLGIGCLLVGATITVALMVVVIQAQGLLFRNMPDWRDYL